MSRTILIIGGGGQLGGAVADVFRSRGWAVLLPSRQEIDIQNGELTRKRIVELRPDVVLNVAWYPVQPSEENPALAYGVNALGAHACAMGAKEAGAISLYVSTDYVFDGSDPEGFCEDDCPNPLNIYGASKLAGEQLTRIANPENYIIRTSALFGLHAKPLGNFVLKMKARAEANEVTSVVGDQTTCPTFAEDLALSMYQLVEEMPAYGIYHITNQGTATWFDLAQKIFQHSGKENLLSASQTDQSGMKRPGYSVLRNEKLKSLPLGHLPHWEDALQRYLHLLDKQNEA